MYLGNINISPEKHVLFQWSCICFICSYVERLKISPRIEGVDYFRSRHQLSFQTNTSCRKFRLSPPLWEARSRTPIIKQVITPFHCSEVWVTFCRCDNWNISFNWYDGITLNKPEDGFAVFLIAMPTPDQHILDVWPMTSKILIITMPIFKS